MSNELYRVTYNGEGVYNALKNNISTDEWKRLLSTKEFSWLPKPPNYTHANKSYFTKEGYIKFNSLVLPLISKYLSVDKIKVECVRISEQIIYKDEYQVIISE